MGLAEPKVYSDYPGAVADLAHSVELFSEAARANAQYLEAQYGLATALFSLSAYGAACTA